MRDHHPVGEIQQVSNNSSTTLGHSSVQPELKHLDHMSHVVHWGILLPVTSSAPV